MLRRIQKKKKKVLIQKNVRVIKLKEKNSLIKIDLKTIKNLKRRKLHLVKK